jgi:predicted DNA-binding protein
MASKRSGRILSVRVSAPLDRRLKERARRASTSESELVRVLLERGLELEEQDLDATVGERAGKLFGLIDSPGLPRARDARKHLEQWRPDRRG